MRSPRSATTHSAIAQLESDNQDSGDYWICVDPTSVSLAQQKLRSDAVALITIPRRDFERLADWYNREQP